MITVFLITGILIAVIFSGFFSGIETAAYSANTISLHANSNNGDKNATLALSMLSNMPRLITSMLIGTNLSVFIATNLLTNYLAIYSVKNTELITTLILTPFCLIFAESLPKRIAFCRPNRALILSAKLILLFEYIFYPIAIVLSGFGTLLQYLFNKQGHSGNDIIGKIRLYENLEAKTAEGKISIVQYQMASRVMEHERTKISELMLTPPDTFTVEDSMTSREAGVEIRKNGYARALIRTKFMRFTGYIVTINSIMNNEDKLDRPVSEIADKAMLLDRNTPLLHAISAMRKEGARIAIVISRNGVFIGSVHLNSMINSIVHGFNV